MPRAEHCSHANLPHASSSTIAFYGSRLHSWDSYVAGKGYLGGEAYWAAGIDYVLRRLGFDIVYRNTSTPDAPSDFAVHFNAFDALVNFPIQHVVHTRSTLLEPWA